MVPSVQPIHSEEPFAILYKLVRAWGADGTLFVAQAGKGGETKRDIRP